MSLILRSPYPDSGTGLTADSWYTSASLDWPVADMPTPRTQAGAIAEAAGTLLVLGGFTTGFVNTAHRYDPPTNAWAALPNLPWTRADAAWGFLSDGLHVAGGALGGSVSTAHNLYNPDTGVATTRTTLSVARQAPAYGVISGELYVFGGYDGSVLATGAKVAAGVGGWTNLASMPAACYRAASCVLDGKLYVFGGLSSTAASSAGNNAWRYDPSGNAWETLTNMPTTRARASAFALSGKLYVVGGRNASGADVSTAEVYDPATDSWSTFQASASARTGQGAVVDGIYYWTGLTAPVTQAYVGLEGASRPY